MAAALNRNLPSWALDLIRDGLPSEALRTAGSVAVFKAVRRTAMSAACHGWDDWEWRELVLQQRSTLGRQLRHNSRGAWRTDAAVHRDLDQAWEEATCLVSESPSFTKGDPRIRAIGEAARDAAADPHADLRDSDRAVLAFAAEECLRRGTTKVTLPWRAVVEGTGLGERATKNALGRLSERQILVRCSPGRSASPGATGERAARAAIYRLPDKEALAMYLYRETRSVGPPDNDLWDPSRGDVGTPAQIYGTPRTAAEWATTPDPPPNARQTEPLDTADLEAADVVTLTISAEHAEAVAELLNRLSIPKASPPGLPDLDAQLDVAEVVPTCERRLTVVPPLSNTS